MNGMMIFLTVLGIIAIFCIFSIGIFYLFGLIERREAERKYKIMMKIAKEDSDEYIERLKKEIGL